MMLPFVSVNAFVLTRLANTRDRYLDPNEKQASVNLEKACKKGGNMDFHPYDVDNPKFRAA